MAPNFNSTKHQIYLDAKKAYEDFERAWSRADARGEITDAQGAGWAAKRDALWEARKKAHTEWLMSDED